MRFMTNSYDQHQAQIENDRNKATGQFGAKSQSDPGVAIDAPQPVSAETARERLDENLKRYWAAGDELLPKLGAWMNAAVPAEIVRMDLEDGEGYTLEVGECYDADGNTVDLDDIDEELRWSLDDALAEYGDPDGNPTVTEAFRGGQRGADTFWHRTGSHNEEEAEALSGDIERLTGLRRELGRAIEENAIDGIRALQDEGIGEIPLTWSDQGDFLTIGDDISEHIPDDVQEVLEGFASNIKRPLDHDCVEETAKGIFVIRAVS